MIHCCFRKIVLHQISSVDISYNFVKVTVNIRHKQPFLELVQYNPNQLHLEFEVESKTNEIRDLREQCNELDKTVKQRNLEVERLIKKTGELDKELSVRRNATDVNGELSELLLNKDNHIQVHFSFCCYR